MSAWEAITAIDRERTPRRRRLVYWRRRLANGHVLSVARHRGAMGSWRWVLRDPKVIEGGKGKVLAEGYADTTSAAKRRADQYAAALEAKPA